MKRIHFIIIGLLLLLPAFLQANSVSSADSIQQVLDTIHGKARVSLLIKLSEQNRDKSDYSCKKYGEEAFTISKENGYKNLMGLSRKSLGVSYYYWGDMKNAFKYFKEGLIYYRQSGNKEGQSNCLNNIGLVYGGWAKFDSAAHYYRASYLIEKELNNVEGEATSLINLGNICYYRKDYHGALTNYFQAMNKFSQAKDKMGTAMSYNNLAIIFTAIGNYKKALEYLDESRVIYSAIGATRKLSQTLNNMADIYCIHFKEYKKAKTLYEQVLKIRKEYGDKEGVALVKSNLGVLYGHLDNLSKALEYFGESMVIYKEIGDKAGQSMVYQNKANALKDAGLFHQALRNFQESLALSLKIGMKSYTIQNYLGIFKCYAAMGEYKNFNKYFSLYEQNKDTITDKLEESRIAALEAQYKIDTLLRQRDRLKNESTRKEIKIERYYTISIGLSLLVVLLVLILILVKRAKKEEEKYKVKE